MKNRPLIASITSLALAAPLFSAVSIPLNPVADAFVISASPTANYGGAGALSVSAAGLAKGEQQSLMMFDLSAAKTLFDTTYSEGGWVVDSISLQLAASNPGNPVFNSPSASGIIVVRWFNDDSWTEGAGTPAIPGATGVNFNSLAGLLASGSETVGSLSFGGGTSGSNVIPLSLSTGFLADLSAGTTASLNLYAGDSTVSGVFNSRTFSTFANRPVLTLTASAIPEPSVGISAFIALALTTLRRRQCV